MKTICYGINNSHEPNFFKPFLNFFSKQDYEQHIVAHNYIEVPKLVEKMGWPYKVLGKHYGGKKIDKFLGLLKNNYSYFKDVPYFDISITHGNPPIIHTSKIRSKLSITFTDNEINHLGHYTYFPFVDYLITPKSIPKKILVSQGAKESKILQYDGLKEDIYIADYEPNPNFLNSLPFEDFVTLRPEALKNIYISKSEKSIVPILLKLLNRKRINVLYLPRYDTDKAWSQGYDNVFTPKEPINGLDACYYSKAVLTGAGTFAREAACMGTPAVSFFPGKKLLAVDMTLISKSNMVHSRDPMFIIDYLIKSKRQNVGTSRAKSVKNEVLELVNSCVIND